MEWISVKDRMPEAGSDSILLCGRPTCGQCSDKLTVVEGRYMDSKVCFGEYDCTINVSHWMPMPAPPSVFVDDD